MLSTLRLRIIITWHTLTWPISVLIGPSFLSCQQRVWTLISSFCLFNKSSLWFYFMKYIRYCLGVYINLVAYYYCSVEPWLSGALSGFVQNCAAERLLNMTRAVGAIEDSRWFSPPSETVWLRRRTETQPWWRVSGCNYTDSEEQPTRWVLCQSAGLVHLYGFVWEATRRCPESAAKSVQTQSLKWRNVKRGNNKTEQAGTEFLLRAAQLADGMNLNILLKKEIVGNVFKQSLPSY